MICVGDTLMRVAPATGVSPLRLRGWLRRTSILGAVSVEVLVLAQIG
jgi:hypothetical protein